jgi:hypothetical protein
MSLIARLYARRIVNINVNIILAGIFALLPLFVVTKVVHAVFFDNLPSEQLTFWQKKIFGGVTLLTDIVADLACFYALHWLANHWPKRIPGGKLVHVAGDAAAPGYFKDATLVQIERMVLSPLLYTIWLLTQFLLMRYGVAPHWAMVLGFCVATPLIRLIHTLWMLRAERRRKKLEPPAPPIVIRDPRTT